MGAKIRNTDIGTIIERFLDDNESDLSPNMFSALEDVAAEVDDLAGDLLVEIEQRKDELAELQEELEELNNE